MIRSFRCKDTERLAAGYRVRRFASIEHRYELEVVERENADALRAIRPLEVA